MTDRIKKAESELREGMTLPKCRKCGCMKITMESLRAPLSSVQANESSDLLKNIDGWLKQMEPIKYDCLGCKHCFPAVAWNSVAEKGPCK